MTFSQSRSLHDLQLSQTNNRPCPGSVGILFPKNGGFCLVGLSCLPRDSQVLVELLPTKRRLPLLAYGVQ